MYDICCMLLQHLKNSKDGSALLDRIKFALPSFHAHGHKAACQVNYIAACPISEYVTSLLIGVIHVVLKYEALILLMTIHKYNSVHFWAGAYSPWLALMTSGKKCCIL